MADIKYLYKESRRIKNSNLGFTKMMMDISTGEVWNDFFVDENSYKIYRDENIIEVPIDYIIHGIADHILSNEEIAEAIEKWISKKMESRG